MLADDRPEFLTRRTRPTNAYEETLKRLLQSIRLGLIQPGERLPAERDLASMLKVSRDTVRDAIATLSGGGYVVSRRGRYGGTYVVETVPQRSIPEAAPVDLSAAEIEDIVVLRRVLEVGAAREAAARNLSASDRATLSAALEDCSRAGDDDYRRLDSRLHLVIAELTGSRGLVQHVADLRTRVNGALDGIPLLPINLQNSNQHHKAIVNAILAGRPDASASAMADHLDGSEALLHGFLTAPDAIPPTSADQVQGVRAEASPREDAPIEGA